MGRQRILLIDASPAVRETIQAILADRFDVTTVSEGGELSSLESADPFRLAILGETASLPAKLSPEVPVLWLVPDRHWQAPANPHRNFMLSKDFIPAELRTTVTRILSEGPRDGRLPGRSRLIHPFLGLGSVDVAAQAVQTSLPVLIAGPRCTARGAVAQAVHREAGGGPFSVASTRSLGVETAPESGSIFIDRIERLRPEQQDFLLAALQPDGTLRGRTGQPLRVLAGTECGVDEILQDRDFASELVYRLNVLPLLLVPLRDRPQDIAPLAQLIGAQLARALDLAAVSFTPGALARLSNYLWFGDIPELEAVLARTLALCRKELLDADDLRFGLADTGTHPPHTAAAPVPDNATLHSRALDLVINEVAHEIKNPLVTIKTFAQHLRRQGAEGSDEQQLARLAGEAVDDIDNTVENLLQFTRLEEPLRESVALQAVLAPAVALLTQMLRPRTRRVDYRPPPSVSVTVDRSQVIYGLNNLFRALARGLGDTGRIVVGYESPGRIVIEFPTGFDPSEAHLAELVGETRPTGAPSLAAAIAQRVLERNGGVLAFETQRQPPRVTVQFPLSNVEEVPLARNAQTPRVGR